MPGHPFGTGIWKVLLIAPDRFAFFMLHMRNRFVPSLTLPRILTIELFLPLAVWLGEIAPRVAHCMLHELKSCF
jgi:hypothetical protein